jgi:hypothetical protein
MSGRNRTPRKQVSRRRFVGTTGIALAGTAVAPLAGSAVSAAALPGTVTLESLHLKSFIAQRGRRFTVQNGTATATLELVAVSDLRDRSSAGECFSLRFRQLRGRRLFQGTYSFHNHSLGRFPLFIVGNEQTRQTASYTAVINREHG